MNAFKYAHTNILEPIFELRLPTAIEK